MEEDVGADDDAVRPTGLPAELMVLQLMLSDARAVEFVTERLDREWLTESTAGSLIEHIVTAYAQDKWDGPKQLLHQVGGEEEARLVAELALMKPIKQGLETALGDCLGALERRGVEKQVRELRKRLTEADLPNKKRDELLRQILDLQPKLRNISALSMRKSDSSGR